MRVPVILYGIDNQPLRLNSNSITENCFFRSFQNFGVKVLAGSEDTKIFSVKRNDDNSDFIIKESREFDTNENSAYTLYMNGDVTVFVWNTYGEIATYNIKFTPDSEIPEHYYDLTVNHNLPSYEQLLMCIVDGEQEKILQRLLLDFRRILKYKGTKVGIEKFLNFIGFNPESIKVYPEYFNPDTQTRTISPDTTICYKTGNYHVLYDNWTVDPDDRYTEKNMPKRLLNIVDLEDFFKRLYYALSIANQYFTSPEQDISFFGIAYSANSQQFNSVAGNSWCVFKQDPHHFQKNIHINLVKYYTENIKRNIIRNCLLVNGVTENSEVKFLSIPGNTNLELFFVEREIFDSEVYTGDFANYNSGFGNLLHFTIDSKNTYVEYTIEHTQFPMLRLKRNKEWLGEEPIEVQYMQTIAGKYRIEVKVWDNYNNQEVYEYFYEVSANSADIDFNMYNSAALEDTGSDNGLTTGISSPSLMSFPGGSYNNYILPLALIPENAEMDLTDYFDVVPTPQLTYLTNNSRYILPRMNPNFVVNSCTDTIPVEFMDSWIDIISVAKPIEPSHKLRIRYANPRSSIIEYLDITDASTYAYQPDVLFCTEMMITEGNTTTAYWFVTTRTVGINLTELFDLVIYDINSDTVVCDITDSVSFTRKKFAVNYDFPLFHRETSDFNYPTINVDPDEPSETEYPMVRSLFPKLTRDNYNVKLGDVIACIPNHNFIVAPRNMRWKVYNSFTEELLFETDDYMLKYRVAEHTAYDIYLEFQIGQLDNYNQIKKSIVSSL